MDRSGDVNTDGDDLDRTPGVGMPVDGSSGIEGIVMKTLTVLSLTLFAGCTQQQNGDYQEDATS